MGVWQPPQAVPLGGPALRGTHLLVHSLSCLPPARGSPCAQHSTWHTLQPHSSVLGGCSFLWQPLPCLALPPPWLRPASPPVSCPGLPCVLHGPPDKALTSGWPSAVRLPSSVSLQLCSEAGGACLFLRLFPAVSHSGLEGHRGGLGVGELR